MNRSFMLTLSLACALNMPITHTDVKEDVAKIVAGAGIGYGLDSLVRVSDHDKDIITIFAMLAGVAVAIPCTSYVRYFRAQWSFNSINAELMTMLANNQNNSADLMRAIELYYLKSEYSLLQAYEDLLKDDAYLAHAEDLFKRVEKSFLHNTECTTYIKNTLTEIAQLRSFIQSTLITIKQEPRWVTMLAARNAAKAAEKATAIAERQLEIAKQQLKDAKQPQRPA